MTPSQIGQDPAPKRTRESTSKVRTGCITCKARRVKCDERRPICQRCSIGNRTCEYNTAAVAPRRRNVFTVYLPSVQDQPVFFTGNRSVKFFQQDLAPKLDGQFDSRFWGKLVLQLSHSEPPVRHAVAAISTMYQDIESSLRHPAGYVKANPEAQQQWNAAIRSLRARIQEQPHSNMVPLVCCLLFTCFDLFRGHVEASFLHVQSGFKILSALRSNSDVATDVGIDSVFSDRAAIEDHIVPMFSRLHIHCSLRGQMTPPLYDPDMEEDSPQVDLLDSRRRLFEASDVCIRFMNKALPKAAEFQIDIEDLIEQAKCQTRLDKWRLQLDELLARMQSAGVPPNHEALNLLLVLYKVAYIWLRVSTTAEETATDAYHADFQELVHCAEQVVKSDAAGAPSPQLLSFDMHIMGPLFYTALKCRYPATRRRALALLQLGPRREGHWNAHHAYRTAKRVIEFEERYLVGGQQEELPDEAARLHGLPLPDDEDRIYSPGEESLDALEVEGGIVPSPTRSGTLATTFRTKPWGPLGEWQETVEYITL